MKCNDYLSALFNNTLFHYVTSYKSNDLRTHQGKSTDRLKIDGLQRQNVSVLSNNPFTASGLTLMTQLFSQTTMAVASRMSCRRVI